MQVTMNRPRVVIIGAGFGGLAAAKALKHAPVDIEIIDNVTLTFSCPEKMPRIGQAISAGDRSAVAT